MNFNEINNTFGSSKPLTLGEPILSSFLISVHQRLALLHVIWCLVQHAILESHAKNHENVVVDELIALELLVGLEYARLVLGLALVDCRDATELLMVPRVLFLIRRYNFFCGREKYYAIESR